MKKKEWLDLFASQKDDLNFFGAVNILTEKGFKLLDVKTYRYNKFFIESMTRTFKDFAIAKINAFNPNELGNLDEECILWCGCIYSIN